MADRMKMQRHGPFYAATLAAVVCLAILLVLSPRLAAGGAMIVFFVVYLGLMAMRIPELTAAHFRKTAASADEPAPIILVVTLLAAAAAVISLFTALNAEHPASGLEITIAFVSVAMGWLTIHTMFAMHYAHFYWRPDVRDTNPDTHARGLDFPDTPEPGIWEFLYFSFVVGMAAQTSDTAITTTAMRRINLLHAVVSFFFNTVLVAASVNVVVALAG